MVVASLDSACLEEGKAKIFVFSLVVDDGDVSPSTVFWGESPTDVWLDNAMGNGIVAGKLAIIEAGDSVGSPWRLTEINSMDLRVEEAPETRG